MRTVEASLLSEGDQVSVLPGVGMPPLRETLCEIARYLRVVGISSCILDDPDRAPDASGMTLMAAKATKGTLIRAMAPMGEIPAQGTIAAGMQTMVESIFARLDRAGIPYCLLRNRHQIPWGLTAWSDLDVLVPADINSPKLVKLFADLHPGQIVDVRPGVVTFSFPVMDRFLRVDMCYGDLDWRGAPFAYADEVLAGRWNDDGIMVASRMHQAYVTWISKLVWSGFYSETYTTAIVDAWREDAEGFRSLLERSFGTNLAGQLIRLIETDRLANSEKLIPQLRRQLWLRSLRRHPGSQLRASFAQTRSRISTLVHPSGLVVALVGPDGVGKSTVVEEFRQASARQMPCGRVDHITQDRRTLPALPSIASRRQDNALLYAWNALDDWLSHVRWTRYRLTRGRLVIDQRPSLTATLSAGYQGSWLQRRWRGMLAPRPDLIIAMDASPESILLRSPEASRDVLQSQRDASNALAERRPDVHRVDAEQPLQQIVNDVRGLIIRAYATRTHRRYRRLIT